MPKPELMPGYRKHQWRNKKAFIRAQRHEVPLQMCRWSVEDTAKRVASSKSDFPWKFYRGDCHSHTEHSDGVGTVRESAIMARHAGLDFQFITDHWGVTQAAECAVEQLWVGQEPATENFHMGVLGLDHAFIPKLNLYADVAEAQKLGATVFIPHPAGFWPDTIYAEETLVMLEQLPDPFLMEICNGCDKMVSAFDYIDDSAIKLWDRLLMLGKRVHAMGNTDAHAPHGIGIVWNGVFAPRCTQAAILRALRAGHSFVSDAPLIHMRLGAASMGDIATPADCTSHLQLTAVDSHGLLQASLVIDGRVSRIWPINKKTKFVKELSMPRSAKKYVRFEAISRDGRRAYTNPIYLTPPPH